MTNPPPSKIYKVLCADPPWPFDDQLPGQTRGAGKNYPTKMTIEQLCKFPLPLLHDDSTLFMWRVASMQQEALTVMFHWNFELVGEIMWLKKTRHGKRWFGMGRTVRAEHEVCLIGKRGRTRTRNKSIRSVFETDVDGFEAPYTGVHSGKPEIFYEIVEQLREGPYTELFARDERYGWDCYGDEVKNGIAYL